MTRFAPIVLFVYNRPWHILQVLETLSKNLLADQSKLYIYADGPKENATEEQLIKIKEVRSIIQKKKWCAEVEIIELENNNGLANSVINGVTEIINKYGKIIVLEDDLVTTKGFLKYMNTALEKYKDEESVMQISGHSFPARNIPKDNSSFFIPMTTSWGWGTWKRAWTKFDPAAKGYEILKSDKKKEKIFNLDGAYSYSSMMFSQMESGKIDSWAIRWWWSVFMEKGLVLFPDMSLVKNIGFDLDGTNTKNKNPFPFHDFDMNYIVSKFPNEIHIDQEYFEKIKLYISNALNDSRNSKIKIYKKYIINQFKLLLKW